MPGKTGELAPIVDFEVLFYVHARPVLVLTKWRTCTLPKRDKQDTCPAYPLGAFWNRLCEER